MKNILITGSEGFIGSHLTEFLLSKGYNVKACILYNSFNNKGWLKDSYELKKNQNLEYIFCDVRDSELMSNILKNQDVVFHLASLIAIPYSYKASQSYVDTNITGTLNLLNASLKNNISRFIHTSTSEVYGSAKYIPIDEHHPIIGQSPYSASKIAADQLAISFYKSFNLPVSIVRPFNTYGPRQSARAIIPSIISQVILNNKSIKLGYLKSTRDFSYVNDTVNAFYSTFKSSKSIGEIINFGSGYEVSIRELADLIMKLMNKKLIIKTDNIRLRPKKSEVLRLLSSTKKAKKLTKWKPQFVGKSGLSKGLSKTIDWFTKEENLVNYNNDYVI
tara:strand:+ start:75 stop:1073 length:999 start_codon:yes stop_codon:yes gene_type:complete